MANDWFQFKQFIVRQGGAAMKVTTEACLFGAWVANYYSGKELTVLDIGCGTGLLSLMFAQKNSSPVDAVELEEQAFLQATDNVLNSAFASKISVHHSDIHLFESGQLYDLIISNPPFYPTSLRSPAAEVNLARHNSGLDSRQLPQVVTRWLSAKGEVALLLPVMEWENFQRQASSFQLHEIARCFVKQTDNHSAFRVMSVFGKRKPTKIREETIIIREGGVYSAAFVGLLESYYLYL